MISQELKDELAIDLEWDISDPSAKLQYISHLSTKWAVRQIEAKQAQRKLERELAIQTRVWHDYFSGNTNPKFNDGRISPLNYERTVIRDTIIPANEELNAIKSKIAALDAVIDFCSNSSMACKNLSYHIRDHIDWQRYMNGAD